MRATWAGRIDVISRTHRRVVVVGQRRPSTGPPCSRTAVSFSATEARNGLNDHDALY